jgi:hypothetical protein
VTFVEDRAIFPSAVERHSEGVWREEFTQIEGSRRVTFTKPLPVRLIEKYAELAVRQVNVRQTEDGRWFAEIAELPGVWAEEPSVPEALDVLCEVVFDWALVKIETGDHDLPIIGDIDLNVL